ncbi:S41 family peptidase [Stenotrophomonas sp. TWI1149]|uniref:S41 family peptidase n=1 Tax=unclassified Stenotrophomonas TaxID=196198 RepID=UPI003209CDD6
MVTSRGFRSSLLGLLAGLLFAPMANGQDMPTPAVQARIVEVLEREALYRDKVDWQALRSRLQAPDTDPAQTWTLLRDAIAVSSGGHGRWMPATHPALQSPSTRGTAAAAQRAPASRQTDEISATPQRTDLQRDMDTVGRRIGWMTVGAFNASGAGDSPAWQQASLAFAGRLQNAIRSKDRAERCGWVVDLRGNSGGNMWPMLLGLAPLLEEADGEAPRIGAFATADAERSWSSHDGAVWLEQKKLLDGGAAVYRLRHPGAPVAVLFGPRTASSGEATALAFRGRANTRSFGQPTAGFSTGNRTERLPDGSALLVTGNVMVDRNGQGNGGRIAPDVVVGEGEDAAAAARDWLLAQPACAASAS